MINDTSIFAIVWQKLQTEQLYYLNSGPNFVEFIA